MVAACDATKVSILKELAAIGSKVGSGSRRLILSTANQIDLPLMLTLLRCDGLGTFKDVRDTLSFRVFLERLQKTKQAMGAPMDNALLPDAGNGTTWSIRIYGGFLDGPCVVAPKTMGICQVVSVSPA
jgi:hypothetical protein